MALIPVLATGVAVGALLKWRWDKQQTNKFRFIKRLNSHSSLTTQPTTRLPNDSIDTQINHNLKIATITTVLAISGGLGYPLLSLISIPGQIYLSIPFFKEGYRQLFKEKTVRMAVLDATIATTLLVFRFYVVNSVYLILFNLSQKLIHQTRQTSMENLKNVFGEIPRTAWVEINGVEVQKSVDALEVGEIIVVNAGETIPVDGTITAGLASIDQHMLTGESQPVEKEIGDEVFAATTVLSGRISISVKNAGSMTVAAQIETILTNTAAYQSQFELQGQEIADRLALPMLTLGTVTLPFLGASRAIAVLLSDIGYRMRFIGPLSVLNHLLLVSRHSILIKDGRALEALQTVDTFVFDKTGTLTQEQPYVSHIYVCGDYDEETVLQYAAAAEYRQTHPIARAILAEADNRQLTIPDIDEANYEIGYGVKVRLVDKVILVGSVKFMEQEQVALPEMIHTAQVACYEQGHSLVYVAVNNQLIGAIALQATIRPEAAHIITQLHNRGVTTYVISGDQEQPTRRLAEELGIHHCFAQILPEDKAALIDQLQQQDKQICFVGDGINDSIALKKANVSVSLNGASSVATDTAQVILMDETLKQLVTLYDLAKDLERNMKYNLIISVVPGIICIGGVYLLHWGVVAAGVIGYASLGAGVANALLPKLSKQIDN